MCFFLPKDNNDETDILISYNTCRQDSIKIINVLVASSKILFTEKLFLNWFQRGGRDTETLITGIIDRLPPACPHWD